MKRVRQLPQFHDNMYTSNDLVKPIMIITCDGGSDENPRYQKTISCAIDYICSYNLDALFIGTNAPGRSAFNCVERRMAPLSPVLAGIILPHDHHENHLDNQGKTIDVELEQKNFAHAGSILAEIWSKTVIDKYEVVAEYISPEKAEYDEEQLIHKDWKWRKNHVRESQYMLQIVKCEDRNCCSIPRSSYFNLIIDRFLPPPLPLSQSDDGLAVNLESQNFASLFTTIALGNRGVRSKLKLGGSGFRGHFFIKKGHLQVNSFTVAIQRNCL